MRSDSSRNSAQRGVLRRLLGQISTKTANAMERLALSASDRLVSRKCHTSFQGVQTLESRTLLSATPVDDNFTLTEQLNSIDPVVLAGNLYANDPVEFQGANITDIDGQTLDLIDDGMGGFFEDIFITVDTAHSRLRVDTLTGDYTYNLWGDNDAINALNDGEVFNDSFTVNYDYPFISSSGFNVTIDGVTDAPPADDNFVVSEQLNSIDPITLTGNLFSNDLSDYQPYNVNITDIDGQTLDLIDDGMGGFFEDIFITVDTAHSRLRVDTLTGDYTYNLWGDNDAINALNDGDVFIDSFTVNYDYPFISSSGFNVTINGVTDAPPADDNFVVSEQLNSIDPITLTGNLFSNDLSDYQPYNVKITDIDGQTLDLIDDGMGGFFEDSFITIDTAHSRLRVDTLTGDYTYNLWGDNDAINALNDGEVFNDSFTVNYDYPFISSSGFNVTIDGVTDAPPADDNFVVSEQLNSIDPITLTGNLFSNDQSDYQPYNVNITDIDGQTRDVFDDGMYVFELDTITVDTAHSRLIVDTLTGDYTYDLWGDNDAINALNDGDVFIDSFTVNYDYPFISSSGFNVTINGVTDAPPADDNFVVSEQLNSIDPITLTGNLFSNDQSDYQPYNVNITDIDGQTRDVFDDGMYVFELDTITVDTAHSRLIVDTLTGDYTYDLWGDNDAINALNDGDVFIDSFTVNYDYPFISSSGFNVTIDGVTDAPPADDNFVVSEQLNSIDPITLTGNLFSNDQSDYQPYNVNITDIDGQTRDVFDDGMYVFELDTITVDTAHSRLIVDTLTGDYTYDLWGDNDAINALNDGDVFIDSFTVNYDYPFISSSGFNVTINGVTDAPPADDNFVVSEQLNSIDPITLTGNLFSNDQSDYQPFNVNITDIDGQTRDVFDDGMYVFELDTITVDTAHSRLIVDTLTGDYTYDLWGDNDAINALNDGDVFVDSFTVNYDYPFISSSGFNVTINGVTDAPPADDNFVVSEQLNSIDPITLTGNLFSNDQSDYQPYNVNITDIDGQTRDVFDDGMYVFELDTITVDTAHSRLIVDTLTGDYTYDLWGDNDTINALNDGDVFVDSFTVNYDYPFVSSSGFNVTINGVTDTQAMGETGIVDVSNGSASVALNGTYVNPVVFASSTQNESDPVAVRIDNLSSTGFDIILAEPSNMDGVHATEQVNYYVFEAGVWQLEDGSIVEVGQKTSANLNNNAKETINFEHQFASSNLTVLTHLQTNHYPGWYHTRHGNSTQSGVEFLIQTEEADGSSSLPEIEVVGYLAMESGSGTWDAGTLFEAIQTPNSVKHGWYQVNYAQSFSTTPAVVSTLSTFDGMDDSNTRIRNTSSTGVQVRVAEDTTKDTETNHTTERVDLLAIEAGVQLNGVKIEAEALDIGETGTVSFQNSTSVTITRAFTAPVVFAAVSNNGADPVVVRVDNLTVDSVAGTTTFDLLLAETSNSDGVTAVETVNYMVMEAGTWRLEDGTQVVVGTHNTATTTLKSNKVFDTISTPSMNSPVVMTQLQTNNNSGWVSTRVRNKAATSFQVALEPEEGNQVVFPNAESIGYMVIEAGGGTWDGMDYFAASTPDQVTQNNYAIDLGGLNAADAYFVGSLSKYDGADPSRIRFSNDLTNILVTVEEDTTSDSEVGHTTEAIDYFLFTGVQTLTGFAAE